MELLFLQSSQTEKSVVSRSSRSFTTISTGLSLKDVELKHNASTNIVDGKEDDAMVIFERLAIQSVHLQVREGQIIQSKAFTASTVAYLDLRAYPFGRRYYRGSSISMSKSQVTELNGTECGLDNSTIIIQRNQTIQTSTYNHLIENLGISIKFLDVDDSLGGGAYESSRHGDPGPQAEWGFKGCISSISSAVSNSSKSDEYLTGHMPVKWYQFSLRTIVLIALPLLSITGFFGTFGLGHSNGTFETLGDLVEGTDPKLPGTDDALITRYIGIAALDKQMAILVSFFVPVTDGSDAALTILSIFGLGQFGAAWTLIMMESLRQGNKGRAVSFAWIGLVGLILQNITYAVTVPLWLFLHVLTSPVAKPFPGSHANSVLLVPTIDLGILPFSVTAGYIIPALYMVIPSSTVSATTHQKFIAFWQLFPIWTVLAHWGLRSICQLISKRKDPNARPTTALGATYLNNAKHVYRFILTFCIITHIPALLIALSPSSLIPGSAPTLATLAQTNIFEAYAPHFPSFQHKAPNLATGIRIFLQWDLYLGSTAAILWAVLLFQNATAEKTILDPTTHLPKYRDVLLGKTLQDEMKWRKLALKISMWSLLSGPIGAVTVLLWERDAIEIGFLERADWCPLAEAFNLAPDWSLTDSLCFRSLNEPSALYQASLPPELHLLVSLVLIALFGAMHNSKSPYSNEEYTVGWISALRDELTVAMEMLDEEHEKAHSIPASDHNAYH
ncbi:hypothetical protein B7494_g5587 [Chlorociboria aeruginascens]|nr:hypothetical protein B7494_g5587 [Chlorociboria aeruginascens]